MEIAAIIIGSIAAIVGIVMFVSFLSRFQRMSDQMKALQDSQKDSSGLTMLNQNLQGVQSRIDETTRSMQKALQTQFGQSTKIIQDVTDRLAKLDETNRQVLDFSEQLQNLQDILKNPKQRGILGEYYLETVLKNVLPPKSFETQYKFSNGEIVDAVIFVKDKIIPVDSKFSLENYNRILETRDPERRVELEKAFKQDLKFRIDETAKYVRPAEGTMDFAFMFIPSEAIYYDLLVNQIGAIKVNTQDLIEYAFKERHVLIVSPTTFLAYLQTVLQGLRALKIEESALEIRKRVEQLAKHLSSYQMYMQTLGKHLSTTVGAYDKAAGELKKVDTDVVRIAETGIGFEKPELERPKTE